MNMKRMRGRNHRPNGGGGGGGSGFRNQQNGMPLNRNHVFDSTGPEMRVRGTAQQLYDKYQQLARDAASSGDRVTGEAYYQHAEHYFRIISAINAAQGLPPQGATPQQGQLGQNEPRQPYQPNQQNPGEYQRRDQQPVEVGQQAEQRQQEPRAAEQRSYEPRQQENRQQEPRRYEQRPQEHRPQEQREQRHRQDSPRQDFERTQFQRPERLDIPTPQPIDISAAIEAELSAATATPGQPSPPQIIEARTIPIVTDAPPAITTASNNETAATLPVKVARPRGRPRLVKPVETEKTDS